MSSLEVRPGLLARLVDPESPCHVRPDMTAQFARSVRIAVAGDPTIRYGDICERADISQPYLSNVVKSTSAGTR